MGVDRLERINSLLKRVIGEAVFRILQGDDVSPAVITVTGVTCGKDLRNATVRVSIFAEDEAEKQRVLGHLVRREHEFERAINREVRMKFTPQLRFVLDRSLEKGDHVLAILETIQPPAPPADSEGADGQA